MGWRLFSCYWQRPHHGVTPLGDIGRVALRAVAILMGCLEIVDVMQPRRVGGARGHAPSVEVEIAEHLEVGRMRRRRGSRELLLAPAHSSCTILLWRPLALVPHASGCGRWWLCPDFPPDGRCLTRWALRAWHLVAMTARRCGLGPGVGVRVVACAVGAYRCSDSGGALAGGEWRWREVTSPVRRLPSLRFSATGPRATEPASAPGATSHSATKPDGELMASTVVCGWAWATHSLMI